MSDICNNGINLPILLLEPCKGKYTSTDCILSPNAITYLGLSVGASQTQINAALITRLIGKDAQIADLQSQLNALEIRIIALEP
jgi:hypothetical protein